MIEELRDYLIRHGMQEEDADEVHDVYADSNPPGFPSNECMDAMADEASEVMEWADDDDHDYSGEVCGLIKAWQLEVGERRA